MKTTSKSCLLSLLALACLPGCIPVVVGGGMAATTSVVGENRDLTSQMEDSWVAMKIRSRFVQSDLVRVGNIGVTIHNGKVLLTGAAINQEEVDEAVRITRETRGVTEVRSEIRVQYVSPSEVASDSLITSKVKAKFLVDQEVRGLNIHVKTTKGVVYLTGEASTAQERDRAVRIAQEVADVREVVSYVEVSGTGGTAKSAASTPGIATGGQHPAFPTATPVPVAPAIPASSGAIHESVSPIAAPGGTSVP